MDTDKVYIVILLVLGIVVLSNLAMLTLVRGSKSAKFDWFKTIRGFDQSYKTQDDSLSELRKRVDDLSKGEKKEG